MANALGRDIQDDEVVVIDKKFVRAEVTDRRFVCTGGNGMWSCTFGQAIFGYWVCDGEIDRIDGKMISVAETLALGGGYEQSLQTNDNNGIVQMGTDSEPQPFGR